MRENAENLSQLFLVASKAWADRPCFLISHAHTSRRVTYRRFGALAIRFARFLQTRDLESGDRVAIIADNSLEWMVAHVGTILAGGVAVPLRKTLPTGVLDSMIDDANPRVVVVERDDRMMAWLGADSAAPGQTVVWIGRGTDERSGHVTMDEALASRPAAEEVQSLIEAAESQSPDAPASLFYVAHQRRRPLGALFHHRHRVAAMRHMAEWLHGDDDDLVLTALPFSYPPVLTATLHFFLSGVPIVLANDPEELLDVARQTSPTIALAIPFAFERIYLEAIAELREHPAARKEIFHWALETARRMRTSGAAPTPSQLEEFRRADLTFFSEIRGRFGGRMRHAYSLGAPLQPSWFEFAETIGLMPLELYSLSEAGGFPAVSRPGSRRAGSCGQVAPGFQIRIADDGEVLVRGPSIMHCYWRSPDQTAAALTEEGWLKTGDLGRFDQDGYLRLTGSKRSVFVLSTSRTVQPGNIEARLIASPWISQAAVFGPNRPYVTALIVADDEAIAERLAAPPNPEATGASDFNAESLIRSAVREANRQLDSWEAIVRFVTVEEPFTAEYSELTEALKLDRDAIARQRQAVIESLYPEGLEEGAGRVTEIQVAPEQLRELVEKQAILDAWMEDAGIGFLFDLARDKKIDAPSMVHICETAAAVAQMQNEERPLSTALIVGDPARIRRVLPEGEIRLHRYDHVRRMRQVIIALAEMVEGDVLGYVIDRHGYLRGIHKLDIPLEPSDPFLLGPQFRRQAAISQQCDAVTFLVPGGGRQVRVFSDGELVGRYAHGIWSAESELGVQEALAAVAADNGIDPPLLRRLIGCAFQMSERNLGAIFLVGDAEAILERSDPHGISRFATVVSTDLAQLTDQALINFAKQDGATIVDRQGQFRSCMVLLRPAADTQAEIGPGKGARHSTAAKISAETNCLAITVSHDGPITLFVEGRQVLTL